MSGGRFDYANDRLQSEIFGYTDEPKNVFEDREISWLVWDVLNLIHEYDWYVCGDICKETYLEAKAEFKKRWLSNRGIRVKRLINESIDELKKELYETFGGLMNEKNHIAVAKDYVVTEVCPHCCNEISMNWSVETLGYKAYCPVCRERLMLCSSCKGDGDYCDYDALSDTCKFNKA